MEEQPDCGGREPNLQEDGWSVFPRACESELGENHKYGRGSAEWRLELKFNFGACAGGDKVKTRDAHTFNDNNLLALSVLGSVLHILQILLS